MADALQYPGRDLEAMSFAANYHRWIVGEFAPYLGRSIVEVGAGVGNVSKLLLEQRIDRLVAFEPSRNLFPLLADALSGEPRATAVNDFFRADSIDGPDSIAYINVLEHVEDDAAEVAAAHRALKHGGHLLLFVPALMALYSDHDKQIGHFRRYRRKALERIVEGAGFTVVKSRYFDVVGIAPWYLHFVVLKNAMTSHGVTMYDRLVVPVMRRIESTIAPPIGKNVLLVARK